MTLPSFDSTLLRLLRWALVPLLATGCSAQGDRAASFGACPLGETCSDETPRGLEFQTSSVRQESFSLFNAVAVGGLMTVSAKQPGGAAAPPFDAFSSSPETVSVVDTKGTTFRVFGVGEGEALIRLLGAGTTELLDRRRFEAHEVATLSLGWPAYWRFAFVPATVFPPLPLAALSSKPVPLALELSSAEGFGLVDEGATFDPPGDPKTDSPEQTSAWWYRTYTVPKGATSFEVHATGGGRATSVVLPLYDLPDGIDAVLVSGLGAEAVVTPLQGAVLSRNDLASFCFRPVADGHELTNAAGAVRFGEGSIQSVGRGCVYLDHYPPVGPMLVRVEVDDLKWDYEVTVE